MWSKTGPGAARRSSEGQAHHPLWGKHLARIFKKLKLGIEKTRPHFLNGRHACGPAGLVADRPTLHENNRMLAIPSHRSRGQAEHIACLRAFQDAFERESRYVMALIDDDLPVVLDPFADVAFAR